jgi:hypothetical protein
MSNDLSTRSAPAAANRKPTLAWLLLSAAGAALAAVIVAGIAAGRLGLPIRGAWLLGAAALGALPQLYAIGRGRWARDWAELAAMLVGAAAVAGLGLALAWPALLPLGQSVDAVHHTQLIGWLTEHQSLPPVNRDTQGLLGEMNVYPVGMALVVIAAARAAGQPALEVLYPAAAMLGGLVAGLVVLLTGSVRPHAAGPAPSTTVKQHSQFSVFHFLALLAGPLLLLAYRTYFMEAYTDHSYYTMVLGVLLVLLASAWLIVPPRISWGQFGLALAALIGTYPLWAPLPAALALLVLVIEWRAWVARSTSPNDYDEGRTTNDEEAIRRWSFVLRRPKRLLSLVGTTALAFGPAAALALVDVLPRLGGGQTVLAHEGVVTLPTVPRLLPLLVAIPCAYMLLRRGRALRLASLAGLAVALLAGIVLAAQLRLAASYHGYKLLFVLLPLAAALIGAACRQAAGAPTHARRAAPLAAALALALFGVTRVAPAPQVQLLDRDTVAAARWLRDNRPSAADQALAVGVPAGPQAYWLQVGLLGQRRDRAESATQAFAAAPPSAESWLVDQRLPAIAIGPAPEPPLPGLRVLAQFGATAVLERSGADAPSALNPLTIRYRAFAEGQRLKTAIELQRPLDGPLPLIEVRLYQAGRPINSFALPPEQRRTRPQYLGVDLLPQTLGGEGYINTSVYPQFAGLDQPPTGALTLTLRLSLGGNTLDERTLATMWRGADGQLRQVAAESGELVYLRHGGGAADLRAANLDFDGALRLVGWRGPARASGGDPLMIDLGWQALRPLDRSLFPEIQLRDAAGRTVAADLAAPQGGFYPTWRWRPGERVTEQRSIALPPGLPPGVYQLAVEVHDFGARRSLGASQATTLGAIVIDDPLARR